MENFDMPIQIKLNDEEKWLFPKAEWNTLTFDSKINTFKIDPDFYVESKKQ